MARKRKYKLNETKFQTIENEEQAYWLGFLYADGNICIKNTGQYTIQCQLTESDSDHLEKLKNFFETDIPLYHRKSSNKTYNSKASKTFAINSKIIFNDLVKFGCIPDKTLLLTFPTFLSEELLPHFIRGYFDGDGSVYKINTKSKYKKINLGFDILGTEDFIINIHIILNLLLDSKCNPKSELRSKHKIYYYKNALNLKKSEILYNYLYNNSTVYLDRKKEKFEEIINLQKQNIQDVQRL